jgi:aspartate carbamoyltransferase catalytic subunit
LNLIELTDLSASAVTTILNGADAFRAGHRSKLFSDFVFGSLFFQPSTRTRISTEAAILNLGGKLISLTDRDKIRAEPLADLVRCIESYIDLVAIRHFSHAELLGAAKVTTLPILNCGTGDETHPTQALSDLFYIRCHFGKLRGVKILLLGDENLRASKALIRASSLVGAEVTPVNPHAAAEAGSLSADFHTLAERMREFDVIYLKPITNINYESPELERRIEVTSKPLVSLDLLAKNLRPDSIILHSLPRFGELPPEIDHLPNAKYFTLANYSVYLRMAVIEHLLLDTKPKNSFTQTRQYT